MSRRLVDALPIIVIVLFALAVMYIPGFHEYMTTPIGGSKGCL